MPRMIDRWRPTLLMMVVAVTGWSQQDLPAVRADLFKDIRTLTEEVPTIQAMDAAMMSYMAIGDERLARFMVLRRALRPGHPVVDASIDATLHLPMDGEARWLRRFSPDPLDHMYHAYIHVIILSLMMSDRVDILKVLDINQEILAACPDFPFPSVEIRNAATYHMNNALSMARWAVEYPAQRKSLVDLLRRRFEENMRMVEEDRFRFTGREIHRQKAFMTRTHYAMLYPVRLREIVQAGDDGQQEQVITDPDALVTEGFMRILGRLPTDEERSALIAYIEQHRDEVTVEMVYLSISLAR